MTKTLQRLLLSVKMANLSIFGKKPEMFNRDSILNSLPLCGNKDLH